MRRIHIQKPLININPRNKKYIDKADLLLKGNFGADELAEIATKLHIPEITPAIVEDFQALWEKNTIKNEYVFVRKVTLDVCGMEMPFYVTTVDGLSFETLEVSSDELEESFVNTDIRCLWLSPERKRSDCLFRGINFRAWRSDIPLNPKISDYLNSLTLEQIEMAVG